MKKERQDCALIIFQKNFVLGKVKTRLAKTIGNEKALRVFKELVNTTYNQIPTNELDPHIFFGQKMEKTDHELHQKADFHLQEGKDLGEKMVNAFQKILNKGYHKVLIIGTDCPFITPKIYRKAIQILDEKDFVIGPANDGGYYLLGAKSSPQKIMENIAWSTSEVLNSTITCIKNQCQTFGLLEELTDIDNAEDYKTFEPIFEAVK